MLRPAYILLLFLFALETSAQYLNTVKFSKEETQLYSPIKGVFEDNDGYLWVYGLDGISRFNGQRFETIDELYPQASLLPSKNCFSMMEGQGFLWVGTSSSGLYAFDSAGKLNKFIDLTKDKIGLKSSRVLDLKFYEDLLFILGDKGLEVFRNKGDFFIKEDIPISNLQKVTKIFLHNGGLWISDNTDLWKLNPKNLEVSIYTNFVGASFFTNPEGVLWISYLPEGTRLASYLPGSDEWKLSEYQPYRNYKLNRHYFWLDKSRLLSFEKTGLYVQVSHFDTKIVEHIDEVTSGLGSELFIRNSYRDSQGRIWLFGSELYLIPAESHISPEFHGLADTEILDMVVTPEKTFASINNKGLLIYDKEEKSRTELNIKNSGLADNFISQLVDFGDGRIGLCMMNYFQIYDKEKGLGKAYQLPGIIRSAYETSDHYWVGGFKNLFKVNKKSHLISDIKKKSRLSSRESAINDIFPLSSDSLTIVTANDGLMKFDLMSEEFDIFHTMSQILIDTFKNYRIVDADISPSGKRIAFATDNAVYFEENRNKIKVPMKSTAYSNVVFYNDSILYSTSKKQIHRINLRNMKITSFDKHNGIMNNYFAIRSSYKHKNGNIYFGGDQGIDKVDESKFSDSKINNAINIDQLFFNGLAQYGARSNSYSVPSEIQVVEVKINSPKKINSQPYDLQTKFSEETSWKTLPSNESFTLYNPSPGKMTPKFRLLDQHGQVSSEEVVVELQVLQKWYEKPILWILGILSLSGLSAFGYFRYSKVRNEIKLRQVELQEELATLKLTSLNAQMNPHFIFNALSSIQHLIASRETEVAEEYLSKFSKLLRHVIQYASLENVSLAEEERFIRNYLDLELLRFENAFKYEIKNEISNSESLKIPPFFIQPQIENALKHGILNQGIDGFISVRFVELDDKIEITIEDNGIGRKKSQNRSRLEASSTKKGIFLTEERINNLNKLQHDSSFKVEDLMEKAQAAGTRVILTFKKEKA